MKSVSKSVALILTFVMLFALLTVNVAAASYSTGSYRVNHPAGVNVRSAPSTSSTILGAATNGTTFSVTRITGSWGYAKVKTTNGAKNGWVCLDFCKKVSQTTASSAASISFPKTPLPSSIQLGLGHHLDGTISSSARISSISAEVLDSRNRRVFAKTVSPNLPSYTLYDSDLDWALPFAQLSTGSYTLKFTVKSGSTTKTAAYSFSVAKKAASSSTSSTSSHMSSYDKNFYVVDGYSTKYCYSQFDYQEYFGNVGCTATSCAIVLSIAGQGIDPAAYYQLGGWIPGEGCTFVRLKSHVTKNAGGKTAVFRMVADELLNGNAVAFWSRENHMVAIVGLRKTANLADLRASDFLIVDPGLSGKITTLDNAAGGFELTRYRYYTAS